MVEPDAFTVGETVAATAGSVVFRDEVFELIQYTPQTEKVWTVPLLMVPPVINKFYVLDISPGRSMVEYFLQQGHQVFTMSWRNPTAQQRVGSFDTYGQAILDALETVHDHDRPSARMCRHRVRAASWPRWSPPTSPRLGRATGWPVSP